MSSLARVLQMNLAIRVIAIVAAELNMQPHDVRVEDDIAELGADALDRVNIAMEIEKEFAVRLTEQLCAGAATVADLIRIVEQLAGEA